jgi:hypothetical protein
VAAEVSGCLIFGGSTRKDIWACIQTGGSDWLGAFPFDSESSRRPDFKVKIGAAIKSNG